MKDTAQDEKLSHPILKWANQTHNVELTLYGSITLVAVIIAVRIERNAETPLGLMVAIWATALGLSIAHVFAVAMSLVGAFYYLRVVKVMYFDEAVTATTVSAAADVRVVLSLNGLLVLVLGIVPGALMSLCARSVTQMLAN